MLCTLLETFHFRPLKLRRCLLLFKLERHTTMKQTKQLLGSAFYLNSIFSATMAHKGDSGCFLKAVNVILYKGLSRNDVTFLG